MKVILLCPDNVFASALTGVIDILNVANRVCGKTVFSWQTISVFGREQVISSQGLPFMCSGHFQELENADVLIWVGCQFTSEADLWKQCRQVSNMLKIHNTVFSSATYQLAGCCGTALFAATGRLDGQAFTCSWWLTPFFKRYFPALTPNAQKITEQSGIIYTAGAAHSYLHLMLRFITDVLGSDIAETIAAWLAIPNEQASQNEFVLLSNYLQHSDKHLLNIQHHINEHLGKNHTLHSLATLACMSERTLIRRFKHFTNMTPFEYIRLARLTRAKQLLNTTHLNIEQIATQVGYQDTQALAKQYKKHFNESINKVRLSMRC
ncbi:GlxA family transcriptional regulator [Pseudoalteromonas sp. T1lg65]|uniref:GlxA family transcriptional regulator n=1 Tax=Pseudoalteromonas sp. T1lg65 TaxID=2077101 RepID=UPI003F79EAA3